MKINCIVVDDEPLGREILEQYIEELTELNLLGSFNSALEAQAYLDQNSVDLIFLDINMPKLSGIEWVKSLDKSVKVIFTTAYSEYAVEAFDVAAFDFLVKPITLQRFLMAVNRAKKSLRSDQENDDSPHILVKEGKRLYKIKSGQVLYLQAYGDYIRVFTPSKTYITKERMNIFKKQLPPNFMQVHRSYLANLDHVEYLEGNQIKIGDTLIPVSAKYKKDIIEKLSV